MAASTFYIVRHTFKGDAKKSAESWRNEMGKRMGEGHHSAVGGQKWIDMGVWNHAMCATDGLEGSHIYCLWESKAGMSDEDMQKFLDSDDGPGFGIDKMNNNMYKLMQAPFMNGQGAKFTDAGPAGDEVKGTNQYDGAGKSTFYMVEHHHKTKKMSDEWWAGMPKMMETLPALQEKHKGMGLANPLFCATGGQGKMFCMWECKEGVSVEELQKVLDGPDVGNGKLLNTPYMINIQAGGGKLPVKSAFA